MTEYHAASRSKERNILLPGQWTAGWTESPAGHTLPDIRYWTPIFGYDC